MKKGAYDFIPKPFEPEQLRIVINRASETIRLKNEALALADERRRTLADLETEKSRIHTILESLPSGTAVTNSQGAVVLMNPAFRKLLNLDPEMKTGGPITDYVPDEGLCDLVMEISKGKHVDFDDIPAYEFSISDVNYFMANARPVLGERNECLGAVINLVDISSMKILDQLKSEFVAKVSHELRSPLSTIHEQLAVVLTDMVEVAPEGDQQILTRAKEKTYGLISLISDLLDLSRIEEGIICREPVSVRLDEMLENIVSFLGSRATNKAQAIEIHLPGKPLPEILADPIALESIFGNLITNAINYTQEGGKISVTAEPAGINIRVIVEDNGFGIEDRHLDQIFERFFREKNDRTRYITGTGLGLPIVKELVSSMNGIIEVESAPGKGSTFTVLLPFKN